LDNIACAAEDRAQIIATWHNLAPIRATKPLLYLSLFFKRDRDDYYRHPNAMRIDGDWEGWLDSSSMASPRSTESAATIAV
jgi:hypothetical protein